MSTSVLRVIRAEDISSVLSSNEVCNNTTDTYGKRKRRASEDDLKETHIAYKRQAYDDTCTSMVENFEHPIYTDGKLQRSNWKATLKRKIASRRSVRIKRQSSKKSLKTDYSLPFGNSFDYFRFSDLMNGIDRTMPFVNNNDQPSVTFQDMDIFYYKQIAANLQDHDLHKKIDHEMKMRDGSMKMLAAAKQHTPQQLEAAKSLHTSNCRMVAYMEYLQKRKADHISNGSNSTAAQGDNLVPCKAKVSISELRVPLIWKNSDHFKNKGNYRRYTVFCLIRIGTELHETNLVTEVDRLMTDISFDDIITIDNVEPNFDCQLEVYAYEHHDDLTIASTQVRLKKKINDISNTVGRRLSGIAPKEPFDMQSLPGPKFELVAQSTLHLSDACERSASFDLTVNKNADLSHQLPLFGNFSCRFVVQPHCLVKEAAAGFLYLKEKDEWIKYWCSLQNLKISCWKTQFEADLQDPLSMIPVTKESIVSDTDPSIAEKPHAFHIQNRTHNYTWFMAADNGTDLTHWWNGFQQHLLDQVVWKNACDHIMEIHERKVSQLSPYFQRDKRGGSLYEKTRVKRSSKRFLLQQHHATSSETNGSHLISAFSRHTRNDTGTTSSTSSNSSTGSSIIGPVGRSTLARTNSYPK